MISYVCFPDGSVVKTLPGSAGDTRDKSSIPELGKSPGEGGQPIQFSSVHSLSCVRLPATP